jgi:hypothetical protein
MSGVLWMSGCDGRQGRPSITYQSRFIGRQWAVMEGFERRKRVNRVCI